MKTCEYCINPIKADASTVTTMTGCVYHEACYEAARINAMAGRYTGQTHDYDESDPAYNGHPASFGTVTNG